MQSNRIFEQAILETLAYSDIFNYPLRLDELTRYLPVRANGPDLQAVLTQLEDRVVCRDGYYFLAGRQDIVALRQGREIVSRRAFRRGLFYGRVLGALPFIRMVGITGSLAVLNCENVDDLDFMLIARTGRVWLARAFALLLNRIARLFGNTICPNLILSERSLEWGQQDLYSAREIAQMVMVSGEAAYSAMRLANKWTDSFFPNEIHAVKAQHSSGLLVRLIQRLLELPLRGWLGDRLEAWEMNRKIERLSRQAGFGEETVFNADICQGNFHHHGVQTRQAFVKRLASLGIDSPLISRSSGGIPEEEERCGDFPETGMEAPILFGQSYYLRFDPKLWDAMQPYPPLGTLYAASYVRARGYDVALFDAMLAESEREWGQALDRNRPKYAVIYEDNFNYLSKMCLLRMREAAFKMIGMAKAHGCTTILCGADATDHIQDYLAKGADFILLGEGEETLGELLDQLSGRSEAKLEDILGLAYVAPDGGTRRNPRRPDIRDLDALPFPAWDLVDVPRYREIWLERHGFYSMNMVTTRGCPYHCNWCAKPIWGQRYNSRSPQNVVAELKWLRETYHPDHIWFADDILGLKPGWIEKFALHIKEAGAFIPFKCLQRADLITEKTAAALADAGCKTVWVGAESGSQKILDAMEKGDKVADIYNAARLLRAQGIEVGFFLQFGYPGETWEDIQDTLQMVRDCSPDDIGISVSYPLPGTKFFERVKLELGEKQNWVDSDDLAMLHRGPYPQEFYRVLHGRVHYEFRTRRALRRPSLRGLAAVPRNLVGLVFSELRLQGMAPQFSNSK